MLVFILFAMPLAAEVHPPDTFTDGLWHPMSFSISADGTTALVVDYASDGDIVYLLDLHEGTHHGRVLMAGPGPGELNDRGDKVVSRFDDGTFFLWDAGDRRASLFDADLEYTGPVRRAERGRIGTMALVNDSTVAVLNFSATEELFTLHRLTRAPDHAVVTDEPLVTLTTAAHPALQPMVANPLLRQFKREAGISLARFNAERRVARAQDLLRETDLRHYEICYLVGFPSEVTGPRTFKRITGQTMTDYCGVHRNLDG